MRHSISPLVVLGALALPLVGGCPPPPSPDAGPTTTDLGGFDPDDGGVPPDGGPGPLHLCAGVDCSALDDQCSHGVCDPITGTCVSEAFPDDTPCVDANPCTFGDACHAGACVGVDVQCNALPCFVASCDQATGQCEQTAAGDGSPCDDGSACTTDDVCQQGSCQGTAVTCAELDDVCAVGVCDPLDGCVAMPKGDGTPCSDADACTIPDVCIGGACVNDPLDCEAAAGPCEVGTCDAVTGACIITPVSGGAPCDDGDACTLVDSCDGSGACRGIAQSCPTTSPCEVATCDAQTGACGVEAVPAGTACDDEDPCTVGDVCGAVGCAGVAKDCASLAGPCQSATCHAASGDCVFVEANEGLSCDDDGTDCVDATCVAGACVPAARGECAACGVALEHVCTNDLCGPAVPELVEGFEAGVLPSSWTTSGAQPWTPSLGDATSGTYGLRSGAIADGESSSVAFDVSCGVGSQLSFMVRVDTEADLDVLELLIDGVVVETWSGALAWQQARYPTHPFLPPYTLGAGLRHVELRYTKSASGSAGLDAVFIDDVRVTDVTTPIDFESGTLAPLEAQGAGAWSVDDTSAAFGARAATLTGVPLGESGALRWAFTLSRTHALSSFVRTELSGANRLQVLVDGLAVANVTGSTAWGALPQQILDAGPHVVRFVVTATDDAPGDRVWVDHLALSPAACP